MKKFYHMASFSSLRSMSMIGLKPNKNPGLIIKNYDDDTEYGRVVFAEGLAGIIAQQAYLNKGYQDIKSGNTEGYSEKDVRDVNATESVEEYLDEPVYVGFDESLVENEGDSIHGHTEESVEAKDINVCVIKNKKTDEISYDGKSVMDFMMSMVPVESIHVSGQNRTGSELTDEEVQATVSEYYEAHKDGMEKYKSGEYTLEEIPLAEFLKTFDAKAQSTIMENIEKDSMVIYRDSMEQMIGVEDRLKVHEARSAARGEQQRGRERGARTKQ